eukprot:18074-Chlamydomonas_euryale.AAC.1
MFADTDAGMRGPAAEAAPLLCGQRGRMRVCRGGGGEGEVRHREWVGTAQRGGERAGWWVAI